MLDDARSPARFYPELDNSLSLAAVYTKLRADEMWGKMRYERLSSGNTKLFQQFANSHGGESVSQSPLKHQAFSTSLD